jgi:hypothetical protein
MRLDQSLALSARRVNLNMLHDVAMKTTYSTKQAAAKAGLHWVTLRRWLASGRVRPSVAVPYDGRTLWRWTDTDVEGLRRYKEAHYRRGRGRKKSPKAKR